VSIYLISDSLCMFNGSILNLSVPLNREGSCGITVTHDLSLFSPILLTSTPSISIEPSSSSMILDRVIAVVVLPEPVLPMIPTFYPAFIFMFTFFKTRSVLGLYLRLAYLNSILPYDGHKSGTLTDCS